MPTSRKVGVVALLGLLVAFLIITLSGWLGLWGIGRKASTDTEYYGEIHSQCLASFLPMKALPPTQLGDREAGNKWHIERMEREAKIASYCNCIVFQAAKRLPWSEDMPLDPRSPEGAAKLTELAGPCMAELQQ